MINNGRCNKGFIWNPSNCECGCDKLRDAGEYIDCKNCKRRQRLIDKLVEECKENVDGNDYAKLCSSCTVYIVLFVIAFLNVDRH